MFEICMSALSEAVRMSNAALQPKNCNPVPSFMDYIGAFGIQVTIPVKVPGQPLASISVLSVHKHDTRLLQLAAILGPLIANAAQQVGKALAKDKKQTNHEEDATTSGVHAVVHVPLLAGLGWTFPQTVYLFRSLSLRS